MGQFISFKSEKNNPWFNPWFILLQTYSNVCATVEGRCLEYLVCIALLAVYRTNNWWRFCKILWPSQNIWTLLTRSIQRVPALRGFWDFRKTALRKIHFSGTVLIIQLMWKSPTNAYIGQNLRKWNPRYEGTRCT